MPDYRLIIDIKDVAPGDILGLLDQLENEIGPEFDIARGEFKVKTSVIDGVNAYPVDRDSLEND